MVTKGTQHVWEGNKKKCKEGKWQERPDKPIVSYGNTLYYN